MKSLLILAVALLGFASLARAQDAIFIAHSGVSEASLGADDVKNILLGTQSKWSASGNIKLVVLTAGATHDKVLQTYTQRSADQFDKYWKKQVFTGKGIMPAQAKTDAEVVDYVSKNPGSFGYVAAGTALTGVKEIPVK